MGPHQRQFLQTQGPVARKESLTATQIFRAGNFLSDPRGNPRKRGPGGKRSYGHEVPVGRVPGDPLGPFPSLGKDLAADAAKHPRNSQRNSIIAPSSGPFGATFPPRGKA